MILLPRETEYIPDRSILRGPNIVATLSLSVALIAVPGRIGRCSRAGGTMERVMLGNGRHHVCPSEFVREGRSVKAIAADI